MKTTSARRLVALFSALAFLLSLMPEFKAYAASPQKSITKGEFAMLINTSFSFQGETSENFSDVPDDHPYAVDFLCAKSLGYMLGDANGRVYPDSLITGAEAAVIISRILDFDLSGAETETDLQVPEWAEPAAAALVDLGISSADLVRKKEISVADAYRLLNALSVAKVTMGTPYALSLSGLKDDFYIYINRRYIATSKSYPGYIMAMPFVDASVAVQDRQQKILEEILNADYLEPGSDEWKVKELYEMYMDNESRTASIVEVEPYLDEIRKAESIADLIKIFEKHIDYFNLQPFYTLGVYSDAKTDASKWATFILPSPLDLGSKDYYEDVPDVSRVQRAYKDYIKKLLLYIGETDDIENRVEAIYEIEKNRAELMLPSEISNLSEIFYTKTTWEHMLNITDATNTLTYSPEILEILKTMNIYCSNEDYIEYVEDLYRKEENLQALKDVALLAVVSSVSKMLGDDFSELSVDLQISMYGGTEGDGMLERRARTFVTTIMNGVFSRLYAEKYIPQQAKDDAVKIVEDVRSKYRSRISNLTWMSEETKLAAIDKLDAIKAYVAYPDDEPAKSAAYEVTPKEDGGSLIELYFSICEANYAETVEAIQKPFKATLWDMISVSEVGAFYSPAENAIIIPGGILQEPFYNPEGSWEENLGGIGAIVAHEITHAFDNTGADYDKNGALTNWWTSVDYAEFNLLSYSVAERLSSIEFLNGIHINGALCAGEAIADLGAVSCVLDIADDDPEADLSAVMEAWAAIWAARMTPETAMHLLYSDTHPPYKVRVNFVLAQMDDFYDVYDITENDGMYVAPEDRINIW